jgi:anti-sigma regulatory factor (Ser/Thr protein kinase)
MPGDGDGEMTLDQAFDVKTLRELRMAVRAEAAAAGMPAGRAAEVMLVVHELAANAVRHGGGAGRARIRVVAGELRCQVSDAGPAGTGDAAREGSAGAGWPWPLRHGHGLWLVRNTADHVSVVSGLGGTEVTAVFAL